MLPDFARVKEKRRRRFIRMVNHETEKLTPLLNHVRTVRQHEGRRLEYETVDGVQDAVDYENRISSALRIQRDDFANMDEGRYLSKAQEMAKELAPQAMRHFFGIMDHWTAQAGTVTDAGGQPFDPMMLIESLEKVDIDFDERSQPQLPTLVANPTDQPAFERKLAEAEKSPEFQRRWNELMQTKLAEYRDREADRKLVG